MKKRKTIIGVTILISFIIVIALGIGGIKVVNANKINSSLELGIKYLTEGNYEEARLEFSKAISIDDKHEKATDLLALTEDYIELNELYANKEYLLAADLISKIKGNKYLEYIELSVNEISANTEAKIVIINEINNLDSQIQQLISENRFQEAIDLINKYLGEDLKQEYLDKLNELMNGVNESKTAYEEEEARIAEERRLEEERKAEEARNKKNGFLSRMAQMGDPNGDYWNKYMNKSDAEMVNIGSEMYNEWDALLNEIWSVLQLTLDKDKMDILTTEQLKWIEDKEQEEAIINENMAGAHSNFVAMNRYSIISSMIRERCYELVNNYM